jgi:hypothetical protein
VDGPRKFQQLDTMTSFLKTGLSVPLLPLENRPSFWKKLVAWRTLAQVWGKYGKQDRHPR